MSEKLENKFNRISLKSYTVNQVGLLTEQLKKMGDNDFQVLLLTAYGFIKGDLSKISSEESVITAQSEQENRASVDLSSLISMRENLIDEIKSEEPDLEIVDNGATLNLENVEIYKDQFENPVFKTNQMLVFANDVISVSLIPRDHLQS